MGRPIRAQPGSGEVQVVGQAVGAVYGMVLAKAAAYVHDRINAAF